MMHYSKNINLPSTRARNLLPQAAIAVAEKTIYHYLAKLPAFS